MYALVIPQNIKSKSQLYISSIQNALELCRAGCTLVGFTSDGEYLLSYTSNGEYSLQVISRQPDKFSPAPSADSATVFPGVEVPMGHACNQIRRGSHVSG